MSTEIVQYLALLIGFLILGYLFGFIHGRFSNKDKS